MKTVWYLQFTVAAALTSVSRVVLENCLGKKAPAPMEGGRAVNEPDHSINTSGPDSPMVTVTVCVSVCRNNKPRTTRERSDLVNFMVYFVIRINSMVGVIDKQQLAKC